MRALTLILLAACGSSSPSKKPVEPTNATFAEPTPTASAPAEPAPVVAEPAPAPAPAAPPAPPPKIYDRLHDADGPVPGLAGFSLKHTPSTQHCGGTKITTTRPKKPAAADKQLAAVFALEFPTGLNFDPERKKEKDASVRKFDDFIKVLTKTGTEAAKYYTDQTMSTNTSTDEAGKLAAIAHYVQVQDRVVSVLARAEIPKDVGSGEFRDDKVAAFCDRLAEVAEPMLARAETSRELCATKVRASTLKGFWNDVCGAP